MMAMTDIMYSTAVAFSDANVPLSATRHKSGKLSTCTTTTTQSVYGRFI